MKLTYKPGKLHKIHIFVDDEYRLTVDDEYWFSEKWHNLKEIDDGELAALEEAVSFRRAYNSVLDLLSRRDHTKKELLRKLSQKYPKEACTAAIEKAETLGLIDEARFAENYARELYEHKHFGLRRIGSELQQKGIDRETAENALEGLDKDAENRIILLLRGKYRDALSSDEKTKRRAVNGLMRLGYTYGEIRDALHEYDVETEEYDYA